MKEHHLITAMKTHFNDFKMSDQNFSAKAINNMNALLEKAKNEFNIGSYEQYKWIEKDCIMEFSTNNTPMLIAKAIYVGSVICNKWTWAWAEEDININCKNKLLAIKEQGIEHNIVYLKNATFKANESVGWVLSAMTALLTDAKLVYRIDRYEATEFYVFTNIVKLNDD